MVAAAGGKAAQLCMAADPLQQPSRTNPLHPTRLQAQDFVCKEGFCATAVQEGIPSNTTGRTEAFLPQQHLNRALFKFRAAGRQLQPSHVSDAAIQVTAKVTYYIKP